MTLNLKTLKLKSVLDLMVKLITPKKAKRGKRQFPWSVAVGIVLFLLMVFPTPGHTTSSNMKFPTVARESDPEDWADSYEPYLQFVVQAGARVNQQQARQLFSTYKKLKARDSLRAGQFLKNLRYELVTKSELMGISKYSISAGHPEIIAWVRRFLPMWAREADEQMFRSYHNYIVHRDRD